MTKYAIISNKTLLGAFLSMESNENTNIMLYAALKIWYENCIKVHFTSNTCRCYSLTISHIKKYQSEVPLKTIQEVDVQNILNQMATDDYAKSTIDKVRIVFQATLRYGIREHLIKHYPIIKLELPRQAKVKKVNALNLYQQSLIETFCQTDECKYGLFTIFLLNTGLRVAEFCNLEWTDYYDELHAYIII